MDERDFAELISVFLKGNEPEETQDGKKKTSAIKDPDNQTNEAAIRKNIIEALAEKIKESAAIEESAEEVPEVKETIVEEIVPEQIIESPEELVTQEEVEQLLSGSEIINIVTLQQILQRFTDLDGVIAAVLVTRDGFTVDYISNIEFDMDMISAVVATGFSTLDKIGYELNQGGLSIAMLEYEHGPVIVSPLIEDVALIIVASQWTTLGRIRWEIKKRSAEIIANL